MRGLHNLDVQLDFQQSNYICFLSKKIDKKISNILICNYIA